MGYVSPDTTLDTMFENACAKDWEDQNKDDPQEEIARIAAHKAYKLLTQAFDILGASVDEGSRFFDSVTSYCNDIEDIMDGMAKEKWF